MKRSGGRPPKKIPKHLEQMIRRAKRITKERAYAYGSSALTTIGITGFDGIATLVPVNWHEMVQEHVKSDLLLVPNTWRFWYGLFLESENGDRRVSTKLVDVSNITVTEAEGIINSYILKFQEEVVAEYGDVVCGYGWIATASATLDLEGGEEGFIEFFEAHDIYNREKAKAIWQQARLANPAPVKTFDLDSVEVKEL